MVNDKKDDMEQKETRREVVVYSTVESREKESIVLPLYVYLEDVGDVGWWCRYVRLLESGVQIIDVDEMRDVKVSFSRSFPSSIPKEWVMNMCEKEEWEDGVRMVNEVAKRLNEE